MDFHQLQYFVAIAESGSITAAAKKLFLSQPPLSMQMKRLEKELGCVLFLRGAREVQLTEAGKLLYTRAKSMLELRRITEEELAVCSEQTSGTIRLGVISSVGCSLLPQWLKWFHAQYPQIRFSLYESDTYQILEKLHQDRVELALVRSPFSAEGIQKVPLQTESLIAVGHHSFFSKADTISLQELAERPLIIYRRWEHILNQTFRTLELPVSYFCVNEDARTTVYWADAGVCLLPAAKSGNPNRSHLRFSAGYDDLSGTARTGISCPSYKNFLGGLTETLQALTNRKTPMHGICSTHGGSLYQSECLQFIQKQSGSCQSFLPAAASQVLAALSERCPPERRHHAACSLHQQR